MPQCIDLQPPEIHVGRTIIHIKIRRVDMLLVLLYRALVTILRVPSYP